MQNTEGDVVASAALLHQGNTVLPYLAEQGLAPTYPARRPNGTWTPEHANGADTRYR